MNMFDNWLIGSTFVAALVATPFFARFLVSRKIALVAPNRQRDVHRQATPRLGGLLISVMFWLAIAAVLIIDPERLRFIDQTVWGIDRNLFGLLLGSVILVATGVLDDLFNLKPHWKLLGQIAAASMLPLFGIEVQRLTNPLGGPYFELSRALDAGLAVVWLVLMINVMNFLDGLDGLATGVGLCPPNFSLCRGTLCPACFSSLTLILLCLSRHPMAPKISLDSGSQLMGYL